VKIKSEQQEKYYGIHVSGLPQGARPSDVELFFSQFGELHPFPKIHILANKSGEAFVNFVSLQVCCHM